MSAGGPRLKDYAIAEGARRARLSCKAGTPACPFSRDVLVRNQRAWNLPASEIPHPPWRELVQLSCQASRSNSSRRLQRCVLMLIAARHCVPFRRILLFVGAPPKARLRCWRSLERRRKGKGAAGSALDPEESGEDASVPVPSAQKRPMRRRAGARIISGTCVRNSQCTAKSGEKWPDMNATVEVGKQATAAVQE